MSRIDVIVAALEMMFKVLVILSFDGCFFPEQDRYSEKKTSCVTTKSDCLNSLVIDCQLVAVNKGGHMDCSCSYISQFLSAKQSTTWDKDNLNTFKHSANRFCLYHVCYLCS